MGRTAFDVIADQLADRGAGDPSGAARAIVAALNADGFATVPVEMVRAMPVIDNRSDVSFTHRFPDGVVRRLAPRSDVFVHRGPDRTVDGVPFGVTYRDGDVYVSPSGPMQTGDEPLWMVEP